MRVYYTIIILLFSIVTNAQTPVTIDGRDSLHMQEKALNDILENGRVCMMNSEWELARTHYGRALKIQPDNLTALFFRAYANQQTGRYSFARNDYEKVVEILPHHFEARLCLALLNQCDNHLSDAYTQLNTLCAMFPDSAQAYAARADVEIDLEMLELAENDMEKAVSISPDNNDYLMMEMCLNLALGKFSDAEEALIRLIDLGIPRPSLNKYFELCRNKQKLLIKDIRRQTWK